MIYRDIVDSTSDLARQLLVEGEPELPLVVWAASQTRGRGRGTNSWWSDAGSLTFTLILDPAAHGLRTEHEPRIALACAVALIDAISGRSPGIPLEIRWPNDVEVEGRKIGGILPERVETARGVRLLIGIGLNVLTRLTDAPREIQRMATSLVDLGGVEPDRSEMDAMLRSFLERFESVLPMLASDDPALADRWRRLDSLYDRIVRVDLGSRVVTGRGRGIDAEGALNLACEREALRLFGGRVLREPDS
jgi:BirA family biotin operon repressor/biotin-[acetyl-CoA-carboxylase] ligase